MRRSIKEKTIAASFVLMCCLVTVLFATNTIAIPRWLMTQEQKKIQQTLDDIFSVLNAINQENLTPEEKKKKALEFIGNYRWGKENKDYAWANDMKGVMLMHPIKTEWNGTNVLEYTDPTGKKIHLEFITVCQDKGEGFVYYQFPKPDGEKPVPKMSFVRLFRPWGWVIGSGLYLLTIEIPDMPQQPGIVDEKRSASPI
jgi:methyl-accepting chemotaxis protein